MEDTDHSRRRDDRLSFRVGDSVIKGIIIIGGVVGAISVIGNKFWASKDEFVNFKSDMRLARK